MIGNHIYLGFNGAKSLISYQQFSTSNAPSLTNQSKSPKYLDTVSSFTMSFNFLDILMNKKPDKGHFIPEQKNHINIQLRIYKLR